MSDVAAVPAPSSKLKRSAISTLVRQYLSAFVPGYAVFADVLSSRLGIDSDKILAVIGFWVAGWASVTYLKSTIIPYIANSFTSYIINKSNDYGHSSLEDWLSARGFLNRSRLLWSSGWATVGTRDSPSDKSEASKPSDDKSRINNFSVSMAHERLDWMPDEGLYWFFHRWRPYVVRWAKQDPTNSHAMTFKLITLGFSTTPIENLIQEAVDEQLDDRLAETTIWRAGGSSWSNSIERPSRPLNTISLDPELKRRLVVDINTFLQPDREDWYAARGVPYRRGYLFHGPPGCGKTSLAFSLAGTFGLDIYIMNLVSGYISESDLTYLMDDLPYRCVLVIEDIDAVAADREKKHGNDKSKKKNNEQSSSSDSSSNNNSNNDSDSNNNSNSNSSNSSNNNNTNNNSNSNPNDQNLANARPMLSLSGLLNAIDGVWAQEGRILIMTSNFPEHLDAAVLRPGRVDRQIEFTLMTRAQIADIFVRMYGSVRTERSPPATLEEAVRPFEPNVDYFGCPYETPDELREAGARFALKFPDKVFSPAMLQEYLIEYFEDPLRAIAAADEWVVRELEKLRAKGALPAEMVKAEAEEKKAKAEAEKADREKGEVASLSERKIEEKAKMEVLVNGYKTPEEHER